MANDGACLFCKIRDGQIPAQLLYQDDHVLAFHDISPQAPFHVIVIPRKHIATLADATVEDAEVLGRLMFTGAKLATEAGYKGSGFRVTMNAGAGAGQSVFHIHLHVLAGRPLSWPPG